MVRRTSWWSSPASVYWLVVSLWSSSSSVSVSGVCLLAGYNPVVLAVGLCSLVGVSEFDIYRGGCPGNWGSECVSVGGLKWNGGPLW